MNARHLPAFLGAAACVIAAGTAAVTTSGTLLGAVLTGAAGALGISAVIELTLLAPGKVMHRRRYVPTCPAARWLAPVASREMRRRRRGGR